MEILYPGWTDFKRRVDRHPFLPKLPQPASWWLGYRARPHKPAPYAVKLLSILLTTLGAMLANEAVVMHAGLLKHRWHVDMLVPSFAASCVLIYGALDAPFSQPRNLVFGHFIAGLIGVCLTKLFMTNKHNEQYLWIAGALSVACSSVAMELTGTTHPPAGATALLPCVNAEMRHIGWNFLPLLLIHSCIFLGVALLCNNIALKYPKYWLWPPTPPPVNKPQAAAPPTLVAAAPNLAASPAISAVSTTGYQIQISQHSVDVPDIIDLTDEERLVLQQLQARLSSRTPSLKQA